MDLSNKYFERGIEMHNDIYTKADVEYGTIKNVYLTIPKDRPNLLCLFMDIKMSKGGQVSYLINSLNIDYPHDEHILETNTMIHNIVALLKKYNVKKLEDIKDVDILCFMLGNRICKIHI